jgi:hypothetical protein
MDQKTAWKDLPLCTPTQYNRGEWNGVWQKVESTDELRPLHQTAASHGWVYRLARCRFKVFGVEDAWQCLDKKWILLNGDSNHVDTVYNLLYHVLGLKVYDDMKDTGFECDCVSHHTGRTFDVSPTRGKWSTRISQIFNGHHTDLGNDEGMESYRDAKRQAQLGAYFNLTSYPDIVVANSGLHDVAAVGGKPVEKHLAELENMQSVFSKLLMSTVPKDGTHARPPPRFVWRSTVPPCGFARCFDANPQTAADINSLIIGKLRNERMPNSTDPFWSSFIDGFDLAYPYHFDNSHCDGGHYGKKGYSAARKTNTTEDFVDHVSWWRVCGSLVLCIATAIAYNFLLNQLADAGPHPAFHCMPWMTAGVDRR